MRRLVALLLLVFVSFLGLRALYLRLAPDETQVRWILGRMVEAYNDGRPGGCVEDVAESWFHEGTSPGTVKRENLLAGLRYRFFQERDTQTRELLLRVRVPDDTVAIRVDGAEAELECEADFERRRGGEWRPTWRIRLTAWLAKDTAHGWQIVRTRHETLDGHAPRY